jgi:two-component system, sensor histidine kinase YesM
MKRIFEKMKQIVINIIDIRSIRRKMFFSYLLIVIPYIIAAYFITAHIGSGMIAQSAKSEEKEVLQLRTNITNYLNNYIILSTNVYFDKRISEYFSTVFINPGGSAVDFYDLLEPTFANYKDTRPEIKTMTIYTKNKSMLLNGDEISDIIPGSYEWDIYNKTLKTNGKILWTIKKDAASGFIIFLNRILIHNNKEVGMLSIGITQESLGVYNKEYIKGSDTYIIGPDGIIMSSTKLNMVGRNFKAIGLENMDTGTPISISDQIINKEKDKVIITKLSLGKYSPSEWKIIKTVPVKLVLKEVNSTKMFLVGIFIIIIIFATLLAGLISQNFGKRINTLVKSMKKVQGGDFSVTVNFTQKDEIGYLGNSFNTMTSKLNELVDEVYNMKLQKMEMEVKKREVELYALQSQINPHFLFNTLEAIQWGLQENNNETSEIVKLLAKSFRRAINWKEDLVTINEEINFVKEYLTIQKFRMQDKLEWKIHVPITLANVKIPKMTLQPLVENSVYHGISLKKGKGLLRINVDTVNEKLIIRLEDDGIGMDNTTLKNIEDSLNMMSIDVTGKHIGIKNVNERLKLYYGENSNMIIKSIEGSGTLVEITLINEPKKRSSENA